MVGHFILRASASMWLQLGGGARIQRFVEKPDADQQASMSMSVDEIINFYKECNIDEEPFKGEALGDNCVST